MMNRSKSLALQFIPVLSILVALDLWTKHLMSTAFQLGESKPIIKGVFNLVLAHNTGAAFSVGRHLPMSFFLITSLVAVGVVVYLFVRLKPEEVFSRWGLIFILSGAIGNLTDRVRLGYVVDFIEVYYKTHYWPAFNVADSAITVGAILYGIDLIFLSKPKKLA